MDVSWHSRCLNDYIDIPNMIVLFASSKCLAGLTMAAISEGPEGPPSSPQELEGGAQGAQNF